MFMALAWQQFLKNNTQVQAVKFKKINKLNFINIKSFYVSKDSMKGVKSQTTE